MEDHGSCCSVVLTQPWHSWHGEQQPQEPKPCWPITVLLAEELTVSCKRATGMHGAGWGSRTRCLRWSSTRIPASCAADNTDSRQLAQCLAVP